MKKIFKNGMLLKLMIFVIPAVLSLSCGMSSQIYTQPDENYPVSGNQDEQNYVPAEDLDYQTFYDDLSSSGKWIPVDQNDISPADLQNTEEPSYVDNDIDVNYIWRPYEAQDRNWTPYSNGTWVWTNLGWVWISDYNWGWAAYHYGRWWHSPVYGWVWSPGHRWAPTWVTFYCDGDYIGWYPITPWSHWHWHNHFIYVESYYYYNYYEYTYVNERNFTRHITPPLVIDPPEVPGLQNSSLGIDHGNLTSQGPGITQIENSTGTKITTRNISFTDKVTKAGINNGGITLYKPGNSTKKVTQVKTDPGPVVTKKNNNSDVNKNFGTVSEKQNGKKGIDITNQNNQKKTEVNVQKQTVNKNKTTGVEKKLNDNSIKTVNTSKNTGTVKKESTTNNKIGVVKNSNVKQPNVNQNQTVIKKDVTKSNNNSVKSNNTFTGNKTVNKEPITVKKTEPVKKTNVTNTNVIQNQQNKNNVVTKPNNNVSGTVNRTNNTQNIKKDNPVKNNNTSQSNPIKTNTPVKQNVNNNSSNTKTNSSIQFIPDKQEKNVPDMKGKNSN
jgi:hypothetical protein